MLDPTQLYDVDEQVLAQEAGGLAHPVLVHGLSGFVDAGSGTRLATAHLLETLEHQTLATFDLDQLLDYRSRRPTMMFAQDHWESYDAPTLVLSLVRDSEGTPFLLLTGREPDVQWERFVAAVRQLVQRLDVRLTVGMNAIPMAVPHTRPTGVSAHATRSELVAGRPTWVGRVQVPASAASLLELRLGEWGHDAMGFAVHVPHYLAQSHYPDAARTLVESVAEVSGLVLPTAALRTAAQETQTAIEAQVADSQDVVEVVHALEQQYDAYAGAGGRSTLLAPGREELPTADELGAELERFLAQHDGRDDVPPGS